MAPMPSILTDARAGLAFFSKHIDTHAFRREQLIIFIKFVGFFCLQII